MPKYVVHYFNGKGLGEPIRLLLAYGGEGFEDHRIAGKDWPEFKKNTPFGQMPYIEFDGKTYAQSTSICRYLGNKYGLAGDTPEEALEIDQLVDLFIDFRLKAAAVTYEKDEKLKEQRFEEYSKDVFPEHLERFKNLIEKNNGHFALGKLTWADFYFAGFFASLKFMVRIPDLEKKYPAFQKVLDHVYSIPKVKAYADAVGPTEF
uniref:glutathione transferase n=2 Tax=Spodoptera frugiperda TaxID=7108 RepID=A0A5Q0TYT9_SPOFR|nr:glutathione S-transferase GST sigma3 [Spodoptera frugiperda]